MGARRRSGLAGIVGALALIAVGAGASSAGSSAAALQRASRAKLVSFFRPTGDTLVQKGTGPIRVIVHLRPGARLTKVDVDGVDVTRLLTRGPGGYWGAIVNLDRHLHYGFNDAFATATGRDGSSATAHVRFIVAQRDDSLLQLTSFSTRTAAAPLQLALRPTGTSVRAALSVAQGVSARVYVNDRRVDRAFSLKGGRLSVRLGAGQGLRFGRNLVQILVHKTHPFKRQSSYDIESRTVYIARNAPIASAGADQTIAHGELVQLDGLATELPPGFAKPSFRWRIASAPSGSKARLRNATGSRPSLVPDRPGVYDVRVSVRGTRPGAPPGGLGARDASATGTSNDTATVTVTPDIPPAGVRLDALTEQANIALDGELVLPGSSGCNPDVPDACTQLQYLVLDRRTLERVALGSVDANVAGIKELGTRIDGYSGSLNYLVVLNWVGVVGGAELEADRDAIGSLLREIGAPPLTAAQRQRIQRDVAGAQYSPGSAVGVAGAPAGSAFLRLGYFPSCPRPCVFQNHGGMSGYLRLNGVTGKYDFVFTDYVDFDTDSNQTHADSSPAELTIKLGDQTYTRRNPGGGVSGFHVLLLYPDTLVPFGNLLITTNAADGAEQPAAVRELASLLTRQADNPVRPLVIVQAFGTPHGSDDVWDQAARQIERLGGTRQVFDAMNTDDPRPLNGESAKRKGPYAFVGRVGSSAPLAEASYSLNGLPGRLSGVLIRARDSGFEPMLAGPPANIDGRSLVNTELIHIANQAPQPFPAFKDSDGRPIDAAAAEAVQKFLGGPDVTKLCAAARPTCDIRQTYYQSYGADWPKVQGALQNAEKKCAVPHTGFAPAQCEGIRAELLDEVLNVESVVRYFGPEGLQQAFGAADVDGLANLNNIAQTIKDAVNPPAADNTTSSTLTALSYLSQVGYATPETTPVAAVLGTALSLAGYFTKANGGPDLIGPQVTTSASKLGVELAENYNQAGDHLDDLGRLIVSDYGKLIDVANRVDAAPGPGETDWRVGSVGNARAGLDRAAKQTIYERLVPLAYPKMYDLGGVGNARDWECLRAFFFTVDKHLFADQSDGAQFIARFPGNWDPIIAVAAVHATGNASGARIPGVPNSIAAALFNPVDEDGLGLSKLQFYSPRNGFKYFPEAPSRPAPGTFNGLDQSGVRCELLPDPPGNSS